MSTDQRLSRVSQLTNIKHQSVPRNLDPARVSLPTGYTVCVIGAGMGIGEYIVYAYARARVTNIVIAARSVDDLQRVAQEVKLINENVRVEYHYCDIASATSVSELADYVRTQFQHLDVLVCNAGYAGPVTLKVHEGEPEWVQRAFDVNMMGTYHAAHYFIPLLTEAEDGSRSFFAISSLASLIRRGPIANTGYCVSKMAQVRLVEMLAEQYQDQDLFSIAIHPGAVLTKMAENNTPDEFMPYLVDDVGLCGAFCVWLSNNQHQLQWLNGRFISANWDVDELLIKKDEIVDGDLLKMAMAI